MSWAQSKVLNPSPSFAYIQRCVPSKSSAFRSLLALSGLRSEADEEAEKTLALTPWTWAPREGQRWVQAGGACAVITPVPESPSPERPPRPGGLEQPSGRRPTCCGRESLSLLSFPFSYHLPPHSAFGAKAARSTQDTFFVLILCALPQQASRGPRPQRLCRRPSWVAISGGSLSKIQQSRQGRSIHRRGGAGRVGRPQQESQEVNED